MAKKTTEWFIDKANLFHNNLYTYNNCNYIGSNNNLTVTCLKHGDFSIIASSHLRGGGCKKCWIERCNGVGNKKKLTTEEFIKKSKLKHGDKYDYSKSIYTKACEPIDIICPIHGLFTTVAMIHLQGCNCKKCTDNTPKFKNKNRKKKSTEQIFEEFIGKANLKHNFKYDYSKVYYIDSRNKVEIICPLHGSFWQAPFNHLQNGGCIKCGREQSSKNLFYTKDEFIEKAQKVHKEKYDYSLVEYITSKTKVKILCFLHGIFEQMPKSHLEGTGCPECNRYLGFDRKRWIEYNKGKEGIFYTLKCWNEKEEFYKIGITGNTVKHRYSHKNSMPYNYKIIKEIKSFDLNYIWNLEKEEKHRLKDYKYKPNIIFAGSSKECFSKI